jgi:hypothetical protein
MPKDPKTVEALFSGEPYLKQKCLHMFEHSRHLLMICLPYRELRAEEQYHKQTTISVTHLLKCMKHKSQFSTWPVCRVLIIFQLKSFPKDVIIIELIYHCMCIYDMCIYHRISLKFLESSNDMLMDVLLLHYCLLYTKNFICTPVKLVVSRHYNIKLFVICIFVCM